MPSVASLTLSPKHLNYVAGPLMESFLILSISANPKEKPKPWTSTVLLSDGSGWFRWAAVGSATRLHSSVNREEQDAGASEYSDARLIAVAVIVVRLEMLVADVHLVLGKQPVPPSLWVGDQEAELFEFEGLTSVTVATVSRNISLDIHRWYREADE